MIERIFDRMLHQKPLKINGEAALYISALLQREVEVRNLDGTLSLSGRPKRITPEGEVVLVNCKRYTPCTHGLHGLDVFEVGTVKIGVKRVELEI